MYSNEAKPCHYPLLVCCTAAVHLQPCCNDDYHYMDPLKLGLHDADPSGCEPPTESIE